MEEQNTPQTDVQASVPTEAPAPEPAAPEERDRFTLACAIARGETAAEADATGTSIRAGHKDLNCKGKGPCWYRMVWRNGQWQYFSDERLPSGTFLASDRRATVRGDVFLGEIVCEHDKGGPVDTMYLVVIPSPGDAASILEACEFRKRRDGSLTVVLPDDTEIVVPNPRR